MSGDIANSSTEWVEIQPGQNVTESINMTFNNSFGEDIPYEDFTQLGWVLAILVVLHVGVMTLAIGGNILLFVTVARNPQMHTVINYYIVNLGVCDFLVGIFVMPVKLLELTAPAQWSFLNDVLCTAVWYLQTVVVFSSVLTLVATCIERYIAIVHPLESRVYHSKRRARFILLATWIIPCVVASPYLYGSKAYANYLSSDYGEIHRLSCFDQFSNKFRKGYFIFIFVFLFVVPLCFITGTCFHIRQALVRRLSLQRQGSLRRREANKRKVAKMMIVVVVGFTICWTPYFVLSLISQVHENYFQDRQYFFTMLCLNLVAFLNSCVNPFIYAAMSKRFRNGFHAIARSILCLKQLPSTSHGASSHGVNGALPNNHRNVGRGASMSDASDSGSAQFTMLRPESWRRTLTSAWRNSSSRLGSFSSKRSRSSRKQSNEPYLRSNGCATNCIPTNQITDREVQIHPLPQSTPSFNVESPLIFEQDSKETQLLMTNELKEMQCLPKSSFLLSTWYSKSNPNLSDTDETALETRLRRSSSDTVITLLDATTISEDLEESIV